jgi:hypothetical protein
MTFKIGDKVTWRSGKSKTKKLVPLGIANCEIVGFGTAENGEPAARLIMRGFSNEEFNAYVADLEVQS